MCVCRCRLSTTGGTPSVRLYPWRSQTVPVAQSDCTRGAVRLYPWRSQTVPVAQSDCRWTMGTSMLRQWRPFRRPWRCEVVPAVR